jgi:tRNA threonylcarbamoyladenosine biosynthesis protein TsaB
MRPVLLAIDTATRMIGLALYDGVQVLCESIWRSPDHHTIELAPAVEETLANTGIHISKVGAIAVALGPGSFTGLRIGLALAKGLSLAQRMPLIGIPTLDSLAAAQPIADLPMSAVLQAGRGRLATGWYQAKRGAWQSIRKIEILTAEELAERIESPTLVCGELDEEERRLLARKRKIVLLASPAQSLRRPSFLAELGWRRWQAGDVDDPASLSPIYLHFNEQSPG